MVSTKLSLNVSLVLLLPLLFVLLVLDWLGDFVAGTPCL